jgi:hypothetical protein
MKKRLIAVIITILFFGLQACKKNKTLTVATSTIVSITDSSAISGGTVEINNDLTVIEKGVCWSTIINPTLQDNNINNGTGFDNYESGVNNLIASTEYNVRAYVINDLDEIFYGENLTFITNEEPIKIGDYREGGVVIYLDNSGKHGLICATENQSQGTSWGCGGTIIDGANDIVIGSGFQNTIDIEAGCDEVGTPADLCSHLTLNGFSDWFLPSRSELNLLYVNKDIIDLVSIKNNGSVLSYGIGYWSSTDYGEEQFSAWAQELTSGNFSLLNRNTSICAVRAIREF